MKAVSRKLFNIDNICIVRRIYRNLWDTMKKGNRQGVMTIIQFYPAKNERARTAGRAHFFPPHWFRLMSFSAPQTVTIQFIDYKLSAIIISKRFYFGHCRLSNGARFGWERFRPDTASAYAHTIASIYIHYGWPNLKCRDIKSHKDLHISPYGDKQFPLHSRPHASRRESRI